MVEQRTLLQAIVSRTLQRDPLVGIDEGSGPAGLGYFATAPAIDHLLDQPRLAVEDTPVMRPSSFNDCATAFEESVAKLEYAQVGPGTRAMTNNRLQRLLGRPIRARLRQDQRRRRGRARYPGMAMDQKMLSPRFGQVASKGEELLDIETFRRKGAGAGIDNVVEAQFEAPMRVEGAKSLGLRPAGIEDRQDVTDARLTMEPELVNPANRHLERHQAL
jgi:hypothetical protein